MDSLLEYVAKNATSINDFITKIYYPAGIYAKLAIQFNLLDLLIFIGVNILIFVITIFILSKFYFKINSRLKSVVTDKKGNLPKLNYQSQSIMKSLIQKEMGTFFKTPVFIINAGFSLILFLFGTIMISMKFDSILPVLMDPNGLNISKDFIMNHLPLLVFCLLSAMAYMTSITSSVISLEGKNINILKSLPITVKTILMSKIGAALTLTTPVMVLGTILLIIRFQINWIEAILLILLSVLIPLVSHFIGLIINLKYPKLDAENPTEVVKQSMSSLVSVMLGMVLAIASIYITLNIAEKISSFWILLYATIIYIVLDGILYYYLTHQSMKDFQKLTI
jgi:ABC-2 type transport system permease protein